MEKEKENESEKEENEGGRHEGRKEGLKDAGREPRLVNYLPSCTHTVEASLQSPITWLRFVYMHAGHHPPYITVNIALLFCFTFYLFLTRSVLTNTKARDSLGLIRRYHHNSISSVCMCVCMCEQLL